MKQHVENRRKYISGLEMDIGDLAISKAGVKIVRVFETGVGVEAESKSANVRSTFDVYISYLGYFFFPQYPPYILYTPRTCDWKLPFSIRKGSKAALEVAAREQGGTAREH